MIEKTPTHHFGDILELVCEVVAANLVRFGEMMGEKRRAVRLSAISVPDLAFRRGRKDRRSRGEAG